MPTPPPRDRSSHVSSAAPTRFQRSAKPKRLVNARGGFNVAQIGTSHSKWGDLYHSLLSMSWLNFFGLMTATYVGVNTLFALAYLLDPASEGGIANATKGAFSQAFFFSVQTMASIGYGAMYPQTLYTNLVVTVEALVGLFWLTTATGLMFARFSRPTAKVLFSNVAVVTSFNGVSMLMFRVANQRGNQILEAQMGLTLVRNTVTSEGEFMRRFYDLTLERSRSPIFALTWVALHPIDSNSPLYGLTAKDLQELEAELIVTLIGTDETFSQSIHARHSYVSGEIVWNHRFADIITRLPDGRRAIDYHHFHKIIPSS